MRLTTRCIRIIPLALTSLLAIGAQAQALDGTLKKIQDSNTILIGVRESSIPFSYRDSKNEIVGFSADLCSRVIDAVKKKTGKPNLDIKQIPVTSQNRTSLVQNGSVDLECGVTTHLKSREQQTAFSTTFFIAGTRLLTNVKSGVKDFPDLAGKSVITNAGTTSERILRKMNDEKKMNMNVISGKDYGESFLTLQSGRVAAFMMDDVLLAGARTLAQKPDDWVVTGTPQSFEAYGFMLRRDDPQFKKLVDDTMTGVMKSGEIKALYAKWFEKAVPPKNLNFNFPMNDQLKALYANPNDNPFE
ncbi:MAG: glutamate/aspartate ABC transporter substrate-binding protein [Ralstonia sp.]|jgi:ABC-type amino acid transport substrate-binding protein|uniref:Glutamate/aspartate ABC transporter substrate-binding protein n=3 Tax=Bacteria TaxID=2 RepID=A0A2P4RGF8_RALPI|nr:MULTISPECIES: glutamate/aspartate ABC transporter substrate-binding protein [Ralstonia]MBA4202993.1 glutamine ABC transporter substrate-binding protein GlnH [Ralstonia sp.]MBA4231721.1 glutamine ABC transporter substrate-binding protein GlnH [Ralstonia sp.]MBA4237970.1 glutamine ABC transporter substrate-binding protein GlnH [Ralstonia sp.]MBA4279128.1 glutamine ABC transporter substrate-binding protein GlnH [Ralstonia sp.]MBA4294566.1 glutamine ABC transporter substrate-binding protein Gln